MEEICSGWLIKSPSTKYVTLFSTKSGKQIQIPLKTKWRRRFFSLYKPQGSLPHQYGFDYFKDEKRSRKRGTINLEECTKILASLDSSHYPHLFSLKTVSKQRKERVYYLAADSEQEMSKWVCCLCRLCGLRNGNEENDNSVAPNPPERLDSMQYPPNLHVHIPTEEELTQQILEEIEAIEDGRRPVDNRPPGQRISAESYRELADCSTGPRPSKERVPSVSMPDTAPPHPPNHISRTRELDDDDSEEIYEYSTPQLAMLSDTPRGFQKKSPPSHALPAQNNCIKQVSPSSHSDTTRIRTGREIHESSSSINSKLSHAFSRTSETSLTDRSELYDYPPSRKPMSVEHSDKEAVPPPRPPKPSQRVSVDAIEEIYQNVGESADNLEDLYDIPKSMNLPLSPAPAGSASFPIPCTGAKVHKYVNASARVVATSNTDTFNSSNNGLDHSETNGETNSELNHEFSGELPATRATENVYGCSPTSDAVPQRPYKPRNLSDNALDDNGNHEPCNGDADLVRISQTTRTQSFYKDSVFSDSNEANLSNSSKENIKLPARIATAMSSSSEDSSDSSDDENLYQVPPSRPQPLRQRPDLMPKSVLLPAPVVKRASSLSKVPIPASKSTVPHSSSVNRPPGVSSPKSKMAHIMRSERSSSVGMADKLNRPPPLLSPPVRDIQYVELDQMSHEKTAPEPSPKLTKSPSVLTTSNAAAAATELEYTDIDMLKTQALTETRKERDKNLRKRSEN